MRMTITMLMLFFLVSAMPIERPYTIEIDTEETQRYNDKHGIWKNNSFEIKEDFFKIEIIFEEDKYLFPLLNKKINDRFGVNRQRYHFGVDYDAKIGTLVMAPQFGKIIEKGYKPSVGKYIVIKTEKEISFLFGHLSQIYGEIDDYVEIGQAIGRTGNTGHSTGPHLHMEIFYQNIYMNHDLIFDQSK